MTPTNAAVPNRPCNGVTLIELVVSMAASSALLVGVGSAMYCATQSLDPQLGGFQDTMDGSQMLFDLAAELRCAQSFTKRTATSVEFMLADRNGDESPETIRYAWSGKAGDPLTRQYNGGTIVNVAEDVQEFDLSYVIQASLSSSSEPGGDVESGEVLFLSHDASNSGNASEFSLTTNAKCAEKFRPALPADATSWRITRIVFTASPVGQTSGVFEIAVMDENQGTLKPGNTVDSVQIAESSLVPGSSYEVQFSNAGGLPPSDPYFIVFSRVSGGGNAAVIAFGTGSLNSPDTTFWDGSSGGNWTEDATSDIWMSVWGKVTGPDPNPPPSIQEFLVSVGIKLRLGMEARTLVQTAVQVLNAPEVTGP